MRSNVSIKDFSKINEYTWEIPKNAAEGMRVPGRLFVSEKLLKDVKNDADVLNQISNVATMPGIVHYSMAMPDVHTGYGFPIGGVAGFNVDDGVISPGGVGFDINCGVRLLRSNLHVDDVRVHIRDLIEALFRDVPSGVGSKGRLKASDKELDGAFQLGSRWAVEAGYGVKEDAENCEENGYIDGTDPSKVSHKARQRGRPQLGTLGSGNHFLEVQYVDEILDEHAARVFGLEKGMITVMIHCGSRGAGHQVCTDFISVFERAVKKYNISLPDKQLGCAPINSPEGQDYFAAMCAAANYAWANRQVITHWVRETFSRFFKDAELGLVYDVCHNIAKIEDHVVGGEKMRLCVHRKGATRAFPAGSPDIPARYGDVGQPIIIPGSMGTASYMLRGSEDAMKLTLGSTCHGSGRVMSRSAAKRKFYGENVLRDLRAKNIFVKATSNSMIAEEAPGVYKSSDEVVDVVDGLGISLKVARMLPIGVAKG